MAEPSERDRDALWGEMQEAFWGAYDAAPSGEGVMGASDFGCHAALLVSIDGMSPPDAVAKAIGETGHYGRPRKHELVPREGPGSIAAARAEGAAEARAELAAENSLNREAEIAAILDGMEPHAKDLLSEQMRGLCANIAEVCEAEGRRKAVEECAAMLERHTVIRAHAGMSAVENMNFLLKNMAAEVRALTEPPADGSGA